MKLILGLVAGRRAVVWHMLDHHADDGAQVGVADKQIIQLTGGAGDFT